MPLCKVCGKRADTDYCFRHKQRIKTAENIEEIEKMKHFFLKIWKKRKHYSEVSGVYLGGEPLTVFFHHILAKEKYPKAAFDENNIILLTLDEHTSVENDMYKYEKINEKREVLKHKYESSQS